MHDIVIHDRRILEHEEDTGARPGRLVRNGR